MGSNVLFLLQEINMTGNSEKFIFISERERDQYMESPASPTLSCVQRNSVQFSDTQRESEGDSEHSQTLKESPASFKSFGKLWKLNALPVPY